MRTNHNAKTPSDVGPERVIALDIGGTKLAAGIVARSGEVLASRRLETDRSAQPPAIMDTLESMGRGLLDDTDGPADAIGISYGGPVDYHSGVTVTCHHLDGWEGIHLRDEMESRLAAPAFMDNDANAAALAEAMFGAGKGHDYLLYLTVSSGIGGGIIAGGRVYRGATGMAGEIGHTTVLPDGPQCTCGRRGCLEALASGWSIARRAREAIAAGETDSRLAAMADEEPLTAQAVAAAAVAGDALALRIINETAEFLALGIGAAVNLLNPTLVVIGGGVSKSGAVLFDPLRVRLRNYVLDANYEAMSVVPAALGDDVGLLGGAALAWEA
ncbi:MAG: ROK family protein [Armatimonadota bacterium]|nr:MAG: ROK family protein [Armatimonadota bacterium]